MVWGIRILDKILGKKIDPVVEPTSTHLAFAFVPGMPISSGDLELLEFEEAVVENEEKPSVEA